MGYFHEDVDSPHALLEIASERLPELVPVNIFGFNRTISTDYETIWNDGSTYAYPGSAVQMSAVSASASDTMAVLISGLDDEYNALAEIITMNGTSAVTTANSFYRINSAVILAGSNVGDITISNGGTTYAFIEAGVGTTQACVYTVPAKHSLYIFRISLTSGTVNGNQYITYRNRIDNSSGRILRVAEATWREGMQTFDRQIPFRIAQKNDFQFEAKSSNSTNEASIFVEALLMKDKYDA
jgi:hypothetical protein